MARWCRLRRQSAHVLTAWNPGFARPAAAVNVAANLALARQLNLLVNRIGGSPVGASVEVWPADGRAVIGPAGMDDPDFHEPGFCMWGASTDVVVKVAEQFGQFAIFAFDASGGRSLVPCRELAALLTGSGVEPCGEEPVVDPLYLIAVIKPKQDQRVQAAQALTDLQTATQEEPGCELYDLVADGADSDTWLMIEKWSSREHWNAHMATDHVAAIGRLEAQLMREPTELRFYGQLS